MVLSNTLAVHAGHPPAPDSFYEHGKPGPASPELREKLLDMRMVEKGHACSRVHGFGGTEKRNRCGSTLPNFDIANAARRADKVAPRPSVSCFRFNGEMVCQ